MSTPENSGRPSSQSPGASIRVRRRECAGSQVEDLYRRLEELLHGIVPDTQPKVAARLLELSHKQDASMREYAEAIRADANITGRVLRMSNAAFYAQRQPVTRLERALVVLGLQRARAIAMGFCLSRMNAPAGERDTARRVWGECVYRALLCEKIALAHCPHLSGEAFIVGLMLDSGQSIMRRLIGSAYEEMCKEAGSPSKLFALEYDRLEFTHVDVFAVLARRWRLPRLLVRPVVWHHTLPPVGASSDPAVLLHRVAYFAGSIQLSSAGVPKQPAPQASVAHAMLDLTGEALMNACAGASSEYESMLVMFDDVAERIGDMTLIADSVRVQLMELLDEQAARALRMETRGGAERLIIGGQIIEVEPGRVGEVAAYLTTEGGQRLVSCTVNPERDGADVIARLLGLEDVPREEMGDLMRVMRAIAA